MKIPTSFVGFDHLKVLRLSMINTTDDLIERLISSCAVLEELSLNDCKGIRLLRIHAPNLLSLKLSVFSGLRKLWIHAPNLLSLDLDAYWHPSKKKDVLVQVRLRSVSDLGHLCISFHANYNENIEWDPASIGGFDHLKFLKLSDVSMTNNMIERLISSCIVLEKLSITNCEGISELQIYAPNLSSLDLFV